MPPKRRNRKGDDDDFFASLAAPSSAAAVEEEADAAAAAAEPEPRHESELASKAKTKKRGKDSQETGVVDSLISASNDQDPKAAKAKSKKGRRGQDSDSDEAPAEVAASTAVSKKGKKKNARAGGSDEEDVPVPVVVDKKKKKGKKGKYIESDSGEDVPVIALAEPEPAPASKKKTKGKVNAKAARGKEDASDSDDPLALVNKLAAMSSDEDEQEDEAKPSEVDTAPEAEVEPSHHVLPEEVGVFVSNETSIPAAEVEASSHKPSKARMSKAERKKKGHAPVEPTAPAATEVAVPTVVVSTHATDIVLDEETSNAPDSAQDNLTNPAAEMSPAAAAEEPTPAAEPPSKGGKKTKLQLKLEAAKKAREEMEAKKASDPTPDPVAKVSVEVSKLSLATDTKEVSEKQSTVTTGKNGEVVSTMFGDEVFSEHAVHKKEMKYDHAALKASAEGAQFAVSQSSVNPNDPQWLNALDINIANFSISAHSKELFYNSELNIAHGRRYGLVGPNGAGKSTLLKMISSGELKVPPRVDYLYVEQEVLADDTRAVDAVLKADKERWELVQEEKSILEALDKKADEAKDVRLGEIHARLESINAAAAEGRARRILFGLGFDAEMQVRPTQFFSGGWRMRIALARALFIEPTLLMLDEPTNHLDLNAVIWLDDYLQKWKKTVLIVSHDQDFLNSVCDEILHLEDRKLFYYKGNYDTFKEQETLVKKQRQKDWEKQERKLRELKTKGSSKAGAEKAMLKSKSREPGARAARKAEAANLTSGIESAETKTELLKRPKDYAVEFSFPDVAEVSPPILEVHDVTFQYGPRLPILFKDLNFGLDMSSRVCIVGPNGSGKSTILKLITGEINPAIGNIRRNPRLRVGVYNQHFMDRLPMDEDPVTYLRRMFNDVTYQSARNMLGKYGLEGHAHTIPIRDLSGGQKARVVFVELSLMAPHLLFLDEPTNNLDIESIDALCDALKQYNGGVILVSHDARLIETTECRLWVVEDQNITPWESGFTGYRAHLLRKLEEQLSIIIAGSGERPV